MWGPVAAGNGQPSRSDRWNADPTVRPAHGTTPRVAVMPHCQHVREVVCPHIQLALYSLEQEASSDLYVEKGYRQGRATANGGTTQPVMNTQQRFSITIWWCLPARREPAAMTKASTPHSSLRVEI